MLLTIQRQESQIPDNESTATKHTVNLNQDEVGQPPQSVIKIACVGDSLTRGDIGINVTFGVDDYPTQLQKLLLQQHSVSSHRMTYDVRNFGVNGATGLESVAASYLHTKEFKQALAYKPNIVLLALGTNDSKFLRSPELRTKYTQEIQDSFLKIIQKFAQDNSPPKPRIYFVNRPPYILKDFQRIKQVNVEQYLYPILDNVVDIATSNGWIRKDEEDVVNLTDVTKDRAITNADSSITNSIYINDGLHFNHQGYSIMASKWKDVILSSISS